MKTYADTITAAHELQTHFALKCTSEEMSAYSHARIIKDGDTEYRQTIFIASNIPTYSVSHGSGIRIKQTPAEVYAALCQI
jgi:hypothetical protein